MNYRSSIYNNIFLHDGTHYLYNSSSGALGKLDDDEYFNLLSNPIIKETLSEAFLKLKEFGFVLPESIDERANIRYSIIKNKSSKDGLSLCVCPTYKCNLQCKYCFEDDWQNKEHIMSDEQWAILEKHLDSALQSSNYKSIRITWSGGEPLIASKQIINLIKRVKRKCKERDVKFFNAMATNALLLTPELLSSMDEGLLDSVQITLDGNEEIHNSRRTTESKLKTFKTTLEKVGLLLLEAPKTRALLRVHISKESFNSIPNLISKLEELGLKNKVTLSFSRLRGQSDSLSGEEYAKAEIDLYTLLMNNGWKVSEALKTKIRPRSNGCAAYTSFSYSIDPHLNTFKCWELGFSSNHMFGVIGEDGSLEVNGTENIAHSYDPLDLRKCYECMQLPLCMGGCAKALISEGKTFGNVNEENVQCSSIKHNMIDIVKLYLTSLKASI